MSVQVQHPEKSMRKQDNKGRLSRRSFFKLIFASMRALILNACEFETDGDETATPSAKHTNTPTTTNKSTSTNTPTQTSTPTETPIPCFYLISPEDGAEFGTVGLVSPQKG
jgi:hypothetical protein